MTMEEISKILFNKNKGADRKFYFIPNIALLAWILFSVISLFSINLKYILNGFVISSIIIKIVTIIFEVYFYNEIFIKKQCSVKKYKLFKSFTGYGIIICYVFFSFPRIVTEFYDKINNTGFIYADFILVLICSTFPLISFLFLRTVKSKMLIGSYTKTDIEYEIKLKKDKIFRKKEQKQLRNERNFIQNLWYDWIDIILQAILIVMIINQFLFQMYAIPSESMVPTFMVNDLVVVDKLRYGPQIPLLEKKLPSPIKPKTGDIVVFINPKTFDKSSDVSYKNIFARVFQPFLYRLTFTKLDIDRKYDGQPKERFIVKRLIAGENEKILLVNDKVYKKTKTNPVWTKMNDIKGEYEYGYPDLKYSDYPKLNQMIIPPEIRAYLNEAVKYIEANGNKSIEEQRNKLLKLVSSASVDKLTKEINDFLVENRLKRDITNQKTSEVFFKTFNKNNYVADEITKIMEDYKFVVFYDNLKSLLNILDKYKINAGLFDALSDSKFSGDDNPYETFMKMTNQTYKLDLTLLLVNLLEECNKSTPNFDIYVDKLFLVSLYTDGILLNDNKLNYFERMNFPEYPAGDDKYFSSKELFVLGDNRYNSLDSRLGEKTIDMFIDKDDDSIFSKKVSVSYEPHAINTDYLLGKALFIYFPFDRMGILK